MTDTDDEPAGKVAARLLGEEIRRLRQAAGLTRPQLARALPSAPSLQTLASYELGHRQCPPSRLLELCRALRVSAPDVLTLAMQRGGVDLDLIDLLVDVHLVLRDRRVEVAQLRAWAMDLVKSVDAPGIVRLNPIGVSVLAHSMLYARAELCGYLVGYTPDSAPVISR